MACSGRSGALLFAAFHYIGPFSAIRYNFHHLCFDGCWIDLNWVVPCTWLWDHGLYTQPLRLVDHLEVI